MNPHTIKKVTLKFYVITIVTLLALFGLYWFLTHTFLTIEASPVNAYVTINNAPVKLSRTGKVRKILAPGSYAIKIEAEGYISHIEEIELKRAQRKTVQVQLPEVPRAVTVTDRGQFLSQDSDFNTIRYLGDNGSTIYRAKILLDGNGEVQIKNIARLTEPKLTGIEEIIWSPTGDLALFRKKNGIYIFDFKKYDFISQTESLWGTNIGSAAWAPDNSKIAYYYEPGTGEKSLIFANIANTETTRVANLAEAGIENPILRWSPDSEWLLVIPRSTKYENNDIYLFNAYSRTFKRLTSGGNKLDAIFSQDNNKILVSTYSKDDGSPVRSVISVVNTDGSNMQELNIRADVRKVAWNNDANGLTIATYNPLNQAESLFGYNIAKREKSNFVINKIDQGFIYSLLASNDGKIVIYETKEGIFALKVGD
ncbi:MAG: translocation protein TolB [bacterium ADurb.Bin400]|nr:MAG: translocation protein TolB [bacterium ADurb.Bin400]